MATEQEPDLVEMRLRRCDSVVTREIVGETLLVPITGQLADLQEIFSLNDTGVLVWSLCDGEHSVRAIADALMEEFEVAEDVAREDVSTLAKELLDLGLLERVDE